MTPQPPPAPVVSVSGGSGGTEARLDDMESTAALIGGLGLDLTAMAAAGHRHLVEPNVIASALLDPAGAARFEWAMLKALDGGGGLSGVAISISASAVKLKAAAVAYRTTDELQANLMDAGEFVLGPVTVVATTLEVLGRSAVLVVRDGESPADAVQRVITENPGFVDDLVGGVPGLLASLGAVNPLLAIPWLALGMPTSVPAGAAGLARLYPDGSPIVGDARPDTSRDGRKAPRDFKDIIAALNRRNAHSGEIDVRTIWTTGPDGKRHRSVIVDIPGTRIWNLPGADTDQIQDLGTNLHGIANDTTTFERAVAEALRKAGVEPGSTDPVMLVGHSQGGIVAVHAANSFVTSGRYNVSHVITAGAPVGEVDVPDSVRVLSVENRHDIVPHLDSRSNPDRDNWTTVEIDVDYGTVGGNHGTDSAYMRGAPSIDASGEPSVRDYLDSLDDFLNGDERGTTTDAFAVSRDP